MFAAYNAVPPVLETWLTRNTTSAALFATGLTGRTSFGTAGAAMQGYEQDGEEKSDDCEFEDVEGEVGGTTMGWAVGWRTGEGFFEEMGWAVEVRGFGFGVRRGIGEIGMGVWGAGVEGGFLVFGVLVEIAVRWAVVEFLVVWVM